VLNKPVYTPISNFAQSGKDSHAGAVE